MKMSLVALFSVLLLLVAGGCSSIDVEQVARLAAQKADEGDFDLAIELTEKVLSREPERPDMQVLQGFCLFQAGKKEKALRVFASAAGKHDDFFSQYYYGWALCRMGKSADAIGPLNNALLKADTEEYKELLPDVRVLLARCCLDSNRKEGFAHLQSLLVFPAFRERAELYTCLGHLSLRIGNKDFAESYFQTAYERAPDNPTVLQNMGVYYDIHRVDTRKAQKYYIESLRRRIELDNKKNQGALRVRLRQLANERRAAE